ncbi:hypothetical protein [Streptomyces sp. NBC_01244]|uniref:hypothetical protein n=1 Tax=Streptomyces sp. NBC_01244 TaxID=2903797 RepID=UPI002E0E8959|nr:hypothetical protein OG247_07325 [Streptomyces sp. NBC_01244]
MITARSPIGVLRARVSTGPLRALWLTLLMLGLVYAHGVSAENSPHHSTGPSMALLNSSHTPADTGEISQSVAFESTAVADEVATKTSEHPAEQCMPGQSLQGAATPQITCPDVLGYDVRCDRVSPKVPAADGRANRPPSAASRESAVLQI